MFLHSAKRSRYEFSTIEFILFILLFAQQDCGLPVPSSFVSVLRRVMVTRIEKYELTYIEKRCLQMRISSMSTVEILTEIPESSKNVTLGWNWPA